MKGDFTRNTFDKTKHFNRVLMQQGRVQLDADWNEQADIQQHRVQGLARDLIGAHGWPGAQDDKNLGFGIVNVNSLSPDEQQRLKDADKLPNQGDFLIGKGRYYVDGIVCENEDYCTYLHQPDWPGQPELANGTPYLVYLDVWERHITSLEDIALRESALGALGPDTTTRAKVVWQVKITNKLADGKTDISANTKCEDVKNSYWSDWLVKWQPENRGQLKAKALEASSSATEDACITAPTARYRSTENQLYRVEIHKSGKAGTARFKWSRDNGSVLFPITQFGEGTITLGDLGRDDFHTLEPGQWVELVDDDRTLQGAVNPLGEVKEVRPEEMIVIVEWPENTQLPFYHEEDYGSKHVFLRRWDHHKLSSTVNGAPKFDKELGALAVEESMDPKTEQWLNLENGIQISFTNAKEGEESHYYRAGDYWLIPARTVTGDVEWPGEVGKPDPLPPHGVEHHYAPLALISVGEDGNVTPDPDKDCRQNVNRGIDPGTITTDKIADNAITAAKIQPGSIGRTHLTTGAISIGLLSTTLVWDASTTLQPNGTAGFNVLATPLLQPRGATILVYAYSTTNLASFEWKEISRTAGDPQNLMINQYVQFHNLTNLTIQINFKLYELRES